MKVCIETMNGGFSVYEEVEPASEGGEMGAQGGYPGQEAMAAGANGPGPEAMGGMPGGMEGMQGGMGGGESPEQEMGERANETQARTLADALRAAGKLLSGQSANEQAGNTPFDQGLKSVLPQR